MNGWSPSSIEWRIIIGALYTMVHAVLVEAGWVLRLERSPRRRAAVRPARGARALEAPMAQVVQVGKVAQYVGPSLSRPGAEDCEDL